MQGSGSSTQGEISYVSWNSKVQHILASTSLNGTTGKQEAEVACVILLLRVAVISSFFFSYFSCVGFEEAEACDKVSSCP